jgi:2'-phosphotransferase
MDDIAEDFEEMVSRQGDKGSRGGRGKGGRGGRGGGRGSGGLPRDVSVSKTMSKLLRHQATHAGIQLDKEGFAPLDRVVSLTFFFFIYVYF